MNMNKELAKAVLLRLQMIPIQLLNYSMLPDCFRLFLGIRPDQPFLTQPFPRKSLIYLLRMEKVCHPSLVPFFGP